MATWPSRFTASGADAAGSWLVAVGLDSGLNGIPLALANNFAGFLDFDNNALLEHDWLRFQRHYRLQCVWQNNH